MSASSGGVILSNRWKLVAAASRCLSLPADTPYDGKQPDWPADRLLALPRNLGRAAPPPNASASGATASPDGASLQFFDLRADPEERRDLLPSLLRGGLADPPRSLELQGGAMRAPRRAGPRLPLDGQAGADHSSGRRRRSHQARALSEAISAVTRGDIDVRDGRLGLRRAATNYSRARRAAAAAVVSAKEHGRLRSALPAVGNWRACTPLPPPLPAAVLATAPRPCSDAQVTPIGPTRMCGARTRRFCKQMQYSFESDAWERTRTSADRMCIGRAEQERRLIDAGPTPRPRVPAMPSHTASRQSMHRTR